MKSIILTAQEARDLDRNKQITVTKPNKQQEAPYSDGDTVYIREPWKRIGEKESNVFHYASDAVSGVDTADHFNWSSPVSMPAAAIRYFARVVDIKDAVMGIDMPPKQQTTAIFVITIEKISKSEAEAVDAGLLLSDAAGETLPELTPTEEQKPQDETAGQTEQPAGQTEKSSAHWSVMFGSCHYCGQVLDVGDGYYSQASADAAADDICKCPDASRERRILKNIQDGRNRIEQLFGENAPELGFKPVDVIEPICLLSDAVELVARHQISGLAISIRGYCKAKVGLTSKDKIKVERSEAHSCQLEAGE